MQRARDEQRDVASILSNRRDAACLRSASVESVRDIQPDLAPRRHAWRAAGAVLQLWQQSLGRVHAQHPSNVPSKHFFNCGSNLLRFFSVGTSISGRVPILLISPVARGSDTGGGGSG